MSMEAPSLGPFERAWLALSSQRTTALLIIALSLLASISALVPQGREAVALAAEEGAALLHTLASYGLTDVMRSRWAQALAVLLAANFVAVLYRASAEARRTDLPGPPRGAPHQLELTAALPERAVEALLPVFRGRFGTPLSESTSGSAVSLLFNTGASSRLAPMLLHLGMALLIVGAALVAEPVPEDRTMVRAVLEVKDSNSGYTGVFDVTSGEPLSFFRWRAKYSIQQYLASKDGLGPAIRIERSITEENRRESFWIFLNAPPTFDEKHRKGEVAIRARSMGLVPRPGQGMSSSNDSMLLIAGTGLLLAGLLRNRRAQGLLWVEVLGDQVRLIGLPERKDDAGFARSFERWGSAARQALEE